MTVRVLQCDALPVAGAAGFAAGAAGGFGVGGFAPLPAPGIGGFIAAPLPAPPGANG